jgi:hypothetical protein
MVQSEVIEKIKNKLKLSKTNTSQERGKLPAQEEFFQELNMLGEEEPFSASPGLWKKFKISSLWKRAFSFNLFRTLDDSKFSYFKEKTVVYIDDVITGFQLSTTAKSLRFYDVNGSLSNSYYYVSKIISRSGRLNVRLTTENATGTDTVTVQIWEIVDLTTGTPLYEWTIPVISNGVTYSGSIQQSIPLDVANVLVIRIVTANRTTTAWALRATFTPL